MKKRVLVLLSSYNGEKYISEQIKSIIAQDTECEVVIRIRDDGSQDRTLEIIKGLQTAFPSRIELIEGENIGYNASFFELLATAKDYDYYALCDQDDVWLPKKIQTAVDFLTEEEKVYSGALLYSSTSYLVRNDMVPYGTTRKQKRPFTLYNTAVQCICPGHNQFLNQALVDKVKERTTPSDVYVYDSWILNVAMLYGKVLFNNTPQTYYRQHQSNELGAGSGVFSRLLSGFKRLKKGHGTKYRKQIASFASMNREHLIEKGLYAEIQRFLNARTFFARLRYSLFGKLHRQSRLETLCWRFSVLTKRF